MYGYKKSCTHEQDHILLFGKAGMEFKKFKINQKQFLKWPKFQKFEENIICALLHIENLSTYRYVFKRLAPQYFRIIGICHPCRCLTIEFHYEIFKKDHFQS